MHEEADPGGFPAAVQDDIGFGLYLAQSGQMSPKAKPLHGPGGGVMEVAADDASGSYRAVYTVSIGDSAAQSVAQ
jgi:phage-related protein